MIDRFSGEYFFLSNFYPCEIKTLGYVFLSVENAYQALKCYDDKHLDCWNTFLICSAKDAKHLGKQLRMRENWHKIKTNIMRHLCEIKFSHKVLETELLCTGDEELIEGNWWGDQFWGVCNGLGKNNLGKILMKIRSDIKLRNLINSEKMNFFLEP